MLKMFKHNIRPVLFPNFPIDIHKENIWLHFLVLGPSVTAMVVAVIVDQFSQFVVRVVTQPSESPGSCHSYFVGNLKFHEDVFVSDIPSYSQNCPEINFA